MKPFTCILLALTLFASVPKVHAQTAEWIWHDNNGSHAVSNEVRYFRKNFNVAGKALKAELTVACDDQATVWLNGSEVGSSRTWKEPLKRNVTASLRAGENVLSVQGKNETGVAGLVVVLAVEQEGDQRQVITTDETWLSAAEAPLGWERPDFNSASWSRVRVLAKLGALPWGNVFVATSRTATPASELTVPAGFKIELLRSASEREGSWVSMAVDAKGRLYISPQGAIPDSGFEARKGERSERESGDQRQSAAAADSSRRPSRTDDHPWGGLWRVTLDAQGQIAKWEKVPVPVGAAMGMLWAFDSLYVSGQGPDGQAIYRLRDSNDDDSLDEAKLFKKVPGGAGEHGAHAIVLGPDNKLYFSHGNSTPLIDGIAPDSPYRNYGEDFLLPRILDPVATFFDKLKVPYGHILRTDENGKEWELFAGGFRNQYDIDFNEDGELFTFDSDMEWDVGLPWYRPTRILHVTSGAEFGFREGSTKWPEYYPDSLPSVVDIGLGSPTGVKFGTRSKFPEKYRRALFAMDWTFGRILAVHLEPNGSSYTAKYEDFVKGKGLPVSDLEFGNDGAMYFIVGGRGTQAGLYRVSWSGAQDVNLAKPRLANTSSNTRGGGSSFTEKLSSTSGDLSWTYRSRKGFNVEFKSQPLWKLQGAVRQQGERDYSWDLFNSAGVENGLRDGRLSRNFFRLELERMNPANWRERALSEPFVEPALTALLALARVGTKDDQPAILKALAKWPLDSLSEELKLEKLRVIQLCFIRHGRPSDELVQLAIEKLGKQYPAKRFPLNRELSQLLVWLGAEDVVGKTLDLMAKATKQEEQIWYAYVLREANGPWTPEQRQQYFAWFLKAKSYQGGNSFAKFIGRIRELALAKVPEADRGLIAALEDANTEPAKPRPAGPERQFQKTWTMADFAGELDKVGSGRNFARGKEIYASVQCLQCHKFGNEGGNVGPDLSAVSSRFKRSDLLEAIIEPSKALSEQYASYLFTTKKGDTIVGQVIDDNNDHFLVVTDALAGKRQAVGKGSIASTEISPVSIMPPGLINVLTKEEVLDLLAYIESGGDEKAPQFSRGK